MKKTLFAIFLALVLVLTACAAHPKTQPPETRDLSEDGGVVMAMPGGAPMEKSAADEVAMPPLAAAPPESNAPADYAGNAGGSTLDVAAAVAAQANRMVIKNAELRLLVADTDTAIDGVTQTVADMGGYIVSSRVWFQDWWDGSHKYATITLAVPADGFEVTMRRLRGLGLQVLDEQASGQDVTDQYVDLQAQLDNLEATRDRIRTFLEQAQTVEESLHVNQELSNVEAQIEQIKGRMNYLSQRANYSNITITLEPDLPEEPTPTPMPTPTPQTWNPGETFQEAAGTLTSVYHGLVDIFIWLLVVVLPVLLPFGIVIWLLARVLRRKQPPTD